MTFKSLTPHPHLGPVYPVSRSIKFPTWPSSPFAHPLPLTVPSCVLTGPQHRTDKPQSTPGLAHELGDSPHGSPDAQHTVSCHPSVSFSVFPFLPDSLTQPPFPDGVPASRENACTRHSASQTRDTLEKPGAKACCLPLALRQSAEPQSHPGSLRNDGGSRDGLWPCQNSQGIWKGDSDLGHVAGCTSHTSSLFLCILKYNSISLSHNRSSASPPALYKHLVESPRGRG